MTVTTKKRSINTDIDWHKLVLDENAEGLQLIDSLAQQRFNPGVLAEEAATYVIERLADNSWQRCAHFKGKSQVKTFLHSLIVNLLEEFSRTRFGRPRPPAWLQRQGEIWIKIWKQLCLERQTLPELLQRYEQTDLYQSGWIKQVASVIKARIPNCGEYRFEAQTVDDIASVADSAINEQTSKSTADHLSNYKFELQAETEVFLVLRAVLQEQPTSEIFSEDKAKALNIQIGNQCDRLNELREALVLSDEEIVVLRMVYADGLSKTAVSRVLGLPSHQAGMIANKALRRIRSAIANCELDLASLLEKI
jgi:DNA-directed RNA polymerase specialized sigma24 family protein